MKPIFARHNLFRFVLVCTFLLLSAFRYNALPVFVIVLHDEPLALSPKEFYIKNVTDERADRSGVAWLLPMGATENMRVKAYPVDLQGGGLAAIKHFVIHNLPRDTDLRPVVITVKKFTATESALSGRQLQGQIAVSLSFYLDQGDDGLQHLTDFNSTAAYTRNPGPPQDIEPALRNMLKNGLQYLNTWMNRQAGTNIKLARAVKVTFSNFAEKPEGDTIYYAADRPLTWDDFQSKIPVGKYDAGVLPSFGYDEHAGVSDGVVNISMVMKVSLPKSTCWVRDGSRNDYALNHEQRHFDLVKIVAEHFRRKIQAEKLPAGNFDGPINVESLESYREMNRLQKQYDEETRHGNDVQAQQKWDERIDKELKDISDSQ